MGNPQVNAISLNRVFENHGKLHLQFQELESQVQGLRAANAQLIAQLDVAKDGAKKVTAMLEILRGKNSEMYAQLQREVEAEDDAKKKLGPSAATPEAPAKAASAS